MGIVRSSMVRILIVVGIGFGTPAGAHAADAKQFSLIFKGSLTTLSQLFENPNSPDEFQRSQFFSIKDTWGYGVELRYRFPETDLAIALSADYLRATQSKGNNPPKEDGYRVIPVELTGYFVIPFSGETIGVYIGGGGGAYFGRRIYRIADTEAPAIDQGAGYGIHVLSGISYRFTEILSLNAEMKFRDLQFNSVNKFQKSRALSGSTFVDLPAGALESRVHTNGVIFQLGVVVEL